MADPLSILGGVGSILQIITHVTKLAKSLNEVRESYQNVSLNITLVASQLSTIRAALEALHTWRNSDTIETEASIQLDQDLGLSLSCCAILITVIDGKLTEAGYKPGLGMKQKIKYLWLEDTLKEYVSNLEGQVRALQLLLTIFQCRTATEQKQQLAKAESRSVIAQVRAETMTLGVGETEIDDAMSILSHDPSVHFDVDSIIMQSPAYKRVYGERESRRRKKASGPPPPPPPHRRLVSRLSPPSVEARAQPAHVSPSLETPPQPSSIATNQSSPPPTAPPENESQPPPVPPRPKTRAQPRQKNSKGKLNEAQGTQGSINVWEFLGPNQGGEVHKGAPMGIADCSTVSEVPADREPTKSASNRDSLSNGVADATPSVGVASGEEQSQSSPNRSQSLKLDVTLSGSQDPQTRAADDPPLMRPNEPWKEDLWSEPPTSLEGFRQQLELAFRESAPPKTIERTLSTASRSSRPEEKPVVDEVEVSQSTKTYVPQIEREINTQVEEELTGPSNNKGEDVSTQMVPKTMSVHSSADLYDASVRNTLIDDTSRPPSLQSVGNHGITEAASPAPVDDEVEAEIEGLSFLNQQLAAKHSDAQIIDDSTSTNQNVPEDLSYISEDVARPVEGNMKEPNPIVPSSNQIMLGPQIIMTPSEEENETFASGPSSIPAEKLETAASPSRPPPLPPIKVPSVPPTSVSDPPIFSEPGRISGIESSTASSGRDSSVFEAASTTSSSEPSIDNIMSTLRQSTSNTTATSISIDRSHPAREQAQADLRRLQSELNVAKARGDSRAAQDSLQKSIDVIRRTYLPVSMPLEKEDKKSLRLRERVSFWRFSPGSADGASLSDAAAAGDIINLRAFLDLKVNVDSRGSNFMTPLMRAAMNGHMECLEILKQRGADEFAVDAKGRNVLHLAVASNRLPVVQWLLNVYPPPPPQQLKHRPSILFKATDSLISRPPKNLREASDAEGWKPLHLAVHLDNVGVMKALLAAGVDIESRNNWGRTPLHQAIISNCRKSFDLLLGNRASVNAIDVRSMSPLLWAAKTGHVDMIETLLANGADRYAYDNDGNQPVHQAAWAGGQVLAIETLIDGRKDLETRTKAGESMLHIACLIKSPELANYLLQNGVDVNPWAEPQTTLRDFLSKFKVPLTSLTPLHYACCRGDLEMALLLLDHEAWVNAATPEGVTALMMAAESEDTNTVNLLLNRGAKVNANMPGSMGTALHIAARRGDLETVQQLCRAGANPKARANGSGGNYGRTPAEEATAKCNDKMKRIAVEGYFQTIRQNTLRNARIRGVGERPSYEIAGRANLTAPSLDIRPVQPVSYAPWGQHNVVPLQNGLQSSWPATYPASYPTTYPGFAQQTQLQQTQEQWFDANPLTHVESPPPYQAGSSPLPSRLATQAPVYRPGDNTGPR